MGSEMGLKIYSEIYKKATCQLYKTLDLSYQNQCQIQEKLFYFKLTCRVKVMKYKIIVSDTMVTFCGAFEHILP